MDKPWYEMTAEELIARGHKPVAIQHTDEEGWTEVEQPKTDEDE